MNLRHDVIKPQPNLRGIFLNGSPRDHNYVSNSIEVSVQHSLARLKNVLCINLLQKKYLSELQN